jgi:hypothetical protein
MLDHYKLYKCNEAEEIVESANSELRANGRRRRLE